MDIQKRHILGLIAFIKDINYLLFIFKTTNYTFEKEYTVISLQTALTCNKNNLRYTSIDAIFQFIKQESRKRLMAKLLTELKSQRTFRSSKPFLLSDMATF